MRRRWFRTLFRRRMLIILLLILQALFIVYMVISGSRVFHTLSDILTIISVITALHIIAKKDKGAYKAVWLFLILLFPIFEGLLYLLFTFQAPTKEMRRRLSGIEKKAEPFYSLPGTGYELAQQELVSQFPQVRYLQDYAGFPIYSDTSAQYITPGEELLDVLLPELEKAEKYIFLEFFIVEEGVMWGRILDVLKRKAAQGVKVRLLYDDIGCFLLLPVNYPKQLEALGIECGVFNPFRPVLTVAQNNRDHRKIISIDGKVAFTGGMNLADEYINAIEKHGYWKDAALMLKGKAAWSFTLMFLQMWELCKRAHEDYSRYYPGSEEAYTVPSAGFVQPYADSPMDTENVGEHVYLQILNQAQNYVYINTPYLIVDDSMVSALALTAKRGVDVRIVTPHKWDRWLVHMTTRSYYRDLIKAGVKIYEFQEGFMHAKTFVCDDCVASVGTTNLGFRSLYLHFECGALMFHNDAVMQVKEDFLKTLGRCLPVKKEDCQGTVFLRFFQDILRLFAPLM